MIDVVNVIHIITAWRSWGWHKPTTTHHKATFSDESSQFHEKNLTTKGDRKYTELLMHSDQS